MEWFNNTFWPKWLQWTGTKGDWLSWSMLIVAALIVIVAIFSLGVNIVLSIKYVKFNRKKNSAGMTGVEAARKVLDDNDLQHIKVKSVGSMLFGNSYSHYFKKVRLRRLTKNKTSITALAIGVEKASLAVLDKEGDPDMKARIRLTPLTFFGPIAFVPLVVIGFVLDFFVFKTNGILTIILAGVGLLFFLFSFILSIKTLKTEIKAQKRAYDLLRTSNLATEEEIKMMEELFKLYNIDYVNDIILSALELLYRVLQIVAAVQGGSSSSSSSSNN